MFKRFDNFRCVSLKLSSSRHEEYFEVTLSLVFVTNLKSNYFMERRYWLKSVKTIFILICFL